MRGPEVDVAGELFVLTSAHCVPEWEGAAVEIRIDADGYEAAYEATVVARARQRVDLALVSGESARAHR